MKSSTDTKDVHVEDVALQHYVLHGAGVPVAKAFVVHIDRTYERSGDIEVAKLFKFQEVTEETKAKQAEVANPIKRLRKRLQGRRPKQDIGPHCDSPYGCDFKDHCWSRDAG